MADLVTPNSETKVTRRDSWIVGGGLAAIVIGFFTFTSLNGVDPDSIETFVALPRGEAILRPVEDSTLVEVGNIEGVPDQMRFRYTLKGQMYQQTVDSEVAQLEILPGTDTDTKSYVTVWGCLGFPDRGMPVDVEQDKCDNPMYTLHVRNDQITQR